MKTNLQELRKAAGFRSARAFAESMDMPTGTYTDYEQGRRNFALEVAWQFADALGEAMGRHVSLDELAGREWPRAEAAGPPGEEELRRVWRGLDPERKGRLLADAHDIEIAQKIGGTPTQAQGLSA